MFTDDAEFFSRNHIPGELASKMKICIEGKEAVAL